MYCVTVENAEHTFTYTFSHVASMLEHDIGRPIGDMSVFPSVCHTLVLSQNEQP